MARHESLSFKPTAAANRHLAAPVKFIGPTPASYSSSQKSIASFVVKPAESAWDIAKNDRHAVLVINTESCIHRQWIVIPQAHNSGDISVKVTFSATATLYGVYQATMIVAKSADEIERISTLIPRIAPRAECAGRGLGEFGKNPPGFGGGPDHREQQAGVWA